MTRAPILHNFPENKRCFALIMPRVREEGKVGIYKIVNTRDPSIHCRVRIIEILIFGTGSLYNIFDDWFSYLLFDHPADTILELLKKRYPGTGDEFEIWICLKIKAR